MFSGSKELETVHVDGQDEGRDRNNKNRPYTGKPNIIKNTK